MKNKTIASVVALGLAMGGTAFAGTYSPAPAIQTTGTSGIESTISLGYDHKYEFRGFDLGDDLVRAELGTSVPLSDTVTFDASAWYGTLYDGNYNEVNLVGALTNDFGFLQAGLLFRQYFYDGAGSDNNELGLILTSPAYAGVVFNLDSYYDFDASGWYLELGAKYEHTLTDTISAVLGAGISYQNDYAFSGSAWHHIYVGLGLPITVTETATFTPHVRGIFTLDDLDTLQSDFVVAGASLTVTF